MREPRSQARYRFEGKSESVRDVQFNPLIHHEFAAAFEAGIIQVTFSTRTVKTTSNSSLLSFFLLEMGHEESKNTLREEDERSQWPLFNH